MNPEKEDGTGIPPEDWLYEDIDGEWQNDETLTVKSNLIKFNYDIHNLINNEGSKLPIYPDTLPERIVVRSSGPAGDSHPTAMGLYKKLPGLPPVWEHFLFPDHKLFFDGENEI